MALLDMENAQLKINPVVAEAIEEYEARVLLDMSVMYDVLPSDPRSEDREKEKDAAEKQRVARERLASRLENIAGAANNLVTTSEVAKELQGVGVAEDVVAALNMEARQLLLTRERLGYREARTANNSIVWVDAGL